MIPTPNMKGASCKRAAQVASYVLISTEIYMVKMPAARFISGRAAGKPFSSVLAGD
jgi:hypothetical protein